MKLIEMEDPDIIHDFRQHNGRQGSVYEVFWAECEKFINEEIHVAVDDRRHGCITHLARAISIRDFVEQVAQRCPEDAMIPSIEWVRLQFWPKTPSSYKSLQYTGRFKLKFMVQQRQWRKNHIDSHYAAAVYRYIREYAIDVRDYCGFVSYRYIREYAIDVRDYCGFVSLDDKHKISIGEPAYPVAAAERGRRVPVRQDEYMTVGDHDYTKFSLTPSVVFIIDVPEEISESWFSGRAFLCLNLFLCI